MRILLSLALLLGVVSSSRAEEDAIPVGTKSPAGMLRLAIKDLALRVKPEEAAFQVYFTFHTVPESFRTEFMKVWPFWFNHLSGSKSLIPWTKIPESDDLLQKINVLSAPNWTRTAWALVGNRDYLMTEFVVNHQDAQNFRLLTGNVQNEKTLACVYLINAYQFFRDTMETNRSKSGLDILYGVERHPDDTRDAVTLAVIPRADLVAPKPPQEKIWKAGTPWYDGKVYDKDFPYVTKEDSERYQKQLAEYKKKLEEGKLPVTKLPVPAVAKKGDPDFPRTGADFEKRWDAEVKADDIKKFLIDPRFGGIATGAENDPTAGSFVALNDRAIRITKTRFGWSARTFDVKENVGDKDHLSRFVEIAQGKIAADGGEILASLPNGSQAGLLVNEEDKPVDVAASVLAQIRNQLPIKKGMLGKYPINVYHYDKFADVRTHMSCVICHAPNNGFIPFGEALKESVKKGLQLKSYDAEVEQQVRDFYERWEKQIRSLQEPYLLYIQETTATKDEPKGLSPSAVVDLFKKIRDWYDLPVTLDTVALEFGVDRKQLKNFLLNLNGDARKQIKESVLPRINQLATEQSIPRRTYELEIAREIGLLLSAAKTDEEAVKKLFADKLIEDAVRRLKGGSP